MESLFVIGALGVLGYVVNTSKTSNESQIPNNSNPSITQLTREFNQNVANHLQNPNVIIGGQSSLNLDFKENTLTNNVPFFTSEKSQNTNEMVKNRRLETFTGVNNIDYNPKTETISNQPIKGNTNINGITFEPDIARYSDYMTNAKQNNVTPIEKKYVGPGLGISPNQTASGGFHQRFRVLPDNVNAYRKNTFGGDIITGKSHIDARETTDSQKASKTLESSKLSYSELQVIGSRPFKAGHSFVNAPAAQPNSLESLSLMNNRSNNTCSSGLVGGPNGQGGGSYQFGEGTRTTEHNLPQCATGGVYRSGISGGGYQNVKYLMSEENNRETANCQRLNASNQSTGSYKTSLFTSMGSQRGGKMTCPDQHFGGANSAHNGSSFPSRDGWNADITQNDLIIDSTCTRMGIAGSGVSQSGQTRIQNTDSVRSTLRGKDNCVQHKLTGPASSHISTNTNYDTAYKGSNTYASRELATVMNHVPNTQKTVNLMLGSDYLDKTITNKRYDQNTNRISSNPYGLGIQNHNVRSQLGEVTVSNPNDNENKRDFGFVPKNELRTNIMGNHRN
jgi:hypothetical protein